MDGTETDQLTTMLMKDIKRNGKGYHSGIFHNRGKTNHRIKG